MKFNFCGKIKLDLLYSIDRITFNRVVKDTIKRLFWMNNSVFIGVKILLPILKSATYFKKIIHYFKILIFFQNLTIIYIIGFSFRAWSTLHIF